MQIMEYNKFILTAFESIKSSREASLNQQIIANKPKHEFKPSNIYIQLIVQKNKKLKKIEQWSFVTLKSLVSSQYGESFDPELDSVEVEKKSFFVTLEENLNQFQPKQLIKALQPQKIHLFVQTEEEKLTPFLYESNYIVEIGQYQTQNYTSKVSLKIIHNEESNSENFGLMDDEEEFQVLADPIFDAQKNFKQELKQQIIDLNFSAKRQPSCKVYVSQYQSPLKPLSNQKIIYNQQRDSNQSIYETSTRYIEIAQKPLDKRLAAVLEIQQGIRQLNLYGMTLKELLEGE